ncbi:chitosanase precursor [Bombardia bombarda]|uniref:Endo-chitosanase n=1 Tax=Bombardia bombarda TaxID=252184 RepID=A0AA39TMC0_9PEZI|nr:chitosanase precursor [Bombardia bombarda]
MHTSNRLLLLSALGAIGATARDVPTNVRNFYNTAKSAGTCSNKLATGFYANDDGPNTFSYCGDHLADYNVIYIKGAGTAFVDMDIDCDGTQGSSADDGRCGSSGDTQSITSFQDTVKGYNKGIKDLDANIHPYVVFGNEGSKSGWKTFNPQSYGIKPLSIMAVVCDDKLIYGIWGDENGDDGDKPMVGEASISLATACYGKTAVNGNKGHDATDVLVIAFPGTDAVPGASGATWGASSYATFESSIEALGNKLIARIGGGTTTTSSTSKAATTSTKTTSNVACSWAGHCEGASCTSDDLCDGNLKCTEGECTPVGCSWALHCAGPSARAEICVMKT